MTHRVSAKYNRRQEQLEEVVITGIGKQVQIRVHGHFTAVTASETNSSIMFRQATTRHRSIILLDFLAPSLIYRSYKSKTFVPKPKKQPIILNPHLDGSVFVDRLKKVVLSSQEDTSDPQINIFNTALSKIRHAIARDDGQQVMKHWRHLEQNKLLHFLTTNQLHAISGLLTKSFHGVDKDDSSTKVIEDVALLAAASRSTDALNTCMLVYLERGDAGATIQLYRRFIKALGDKEVWDEPGQAGHREQSPRTALASDGTPRSRQFSHIPGRVNLLLAVTAAHALQDSFEDALRTCLGTVVRFHSATTKAFMKNFLHSPEFQHKLDLYVHRLDIARLVARPPSLSKQVMNLSGAPTTKPLEKLYQGIIDGLSGPDPYLAPDQSSISPQKLVTMTEAGWTSFLVAFLRSRRRDLASNIWSDMARLNVKPGVSMWTALIDAYDDMRAVEDAIAGWNMMIAQGIKPDDLTYRALISTLFNGRRPDEAMKTFETFREKVPKSSTPQTLSVHNTVLHGLLSFNRIQEAAALLQSMEMNGPSPDAVSYNTFMSYYGRRGDFKALAGVMDQMASLGVAGDVFSFSTILSALLKAGRDEAPDLVLSIMRKQGVEPNVATYSAIIDHQMREQDEKNLGAVLRLLHQMEQDSNTQPNEVTYTSILAGIYRGQWLTPEKAKSWRNEIVGRMKRLGVEFNQTTYHVLIKACLEYPYPEGLENGLAYYREMVQRKMPPIHRTWYILLVGLLQRGEWAVADEVINDMYKSGAQPSGAVLELVGKIRRRVREA